MTAPAPIRSAPAAASRAAPVATAGPETTKAWPRAYLWSAGCGRRSCACQSAGTLWNVVGRIVFSTDPECRSAATSVAPQCRRPGRSRWPGFSRKKVTVRVARTADALGLRRSARRSRSADRPRGPARRTAFTPRSTRAASPRDGRAKPRAEQRVDDEIGREVGVGPTVPRPVRHRLPPRSAASPFSAPRSPRSATRTLRPAARRRSPRDEAVAAVVARPGEDKDISVRRPCPAPLRRPPRRRCCMRSKPRCRRRRQPVGLGHLGRGRGAQMCAFRPIN